MNLKPLIIQTNSYKSEWTQLTPNLISLKRKHYYSENFEAIDTFGNYNLYAYAHLNKGELTIKVNKMEYEASGNVSIYIPKFSIINWKIFSPNIQWHAFISNKDFQPLLKNVCIYKNIHFTPKTHDEISDWLLTESPTYIYELDTENSTAVSVKKYIDTHFQESLEISKLAKDFNLSQSQLSKIFKSKYGLSPVEYRSKLRIFQSMYDLLTQNKEVVDIAFNSGFNDLSRFNKQFKKITNTTPSKFIFLK